MRDRLTLIGCAIAASIVAVVALWIVVTQPAARFVVGGAVLAIPVSLVVERWRIIRAAASFRAKYATEGRDLLIVYTASPHWKDYIESNWLPLWRDRSVALNRSDPNWNQGPEAKLWRLVAGPLQHTPSAIVIPRRGKPQIVRFFAAFTDHKHGRSASLQAKERELEAALVATRAAD